MSAKVHDVVLVGAGLIGLATAKALLERNSGKLKVVVIEKDEGPSSQQSGHNSGVIHSGIYYPPGSLKANFCVKGRAEMTRFCEENEIPTWTCGKLIVATSDDELGRLENLFERGKANKVEGLEMVGPDRIKEIEPHVSAVKALWAPKTGIVDFRKVAQAYAKRILELGGELMFGEQVDSVFQNGNTVTIPTGTKTITANIVVNCAGLHADILAQKMGMQPDLRIIPFRGEYYILKKSRESLVKGLIYPVPDPAFPFLGVHFTQTMKGVVEAGPNAVLAFKREGYKKTDFALGDVLRTFTYPGFWKLSLSQWKIGFWEINRSLRKSAFVKSLQRLIPEVSDEDLIPGGSGVRAQAVGSDGALLDDFRITSSPNAIHVLNAPSPGATSSLIIGQHIAEQVETQLLGKN